MTVTNTFEILWVHDNLDVFPDFIEMEYLGEWYELEKIRNYEIVGGRLTTFDQNISVQIGGHDYLFSNDKIIRLRYESE